MSNITNLERAMRVELLLTDYRENPHVEFDVTDVKDLISDFCHLLHLDEKTAGCMSVEEIKLLLDGAFDNFNAETEEAAS